MGDAFYKQLLSKVILFWHSSLTMHTSLNILILSSHFHPTQRYGKEPIFLNLKIFLGRVWGLNYIMLCVSQPQQHCIMIYD